MPRSTVVLGLLTLATVAAVAGRQHERRAAGAGGRPDEHQARGRVPARARPKRARAPARRPDTPPPSIVDYRPRSTLVTAEHPVPKAKFPAIDIHGHPPALTSPEAIASVGRGAGRAQPARAGQRRQLVGRAADARRSQAINASPHKDRFRVLAGIDFRNVGPGWGEKAVKQLEADIKAGAVGVGEIAKSFGLDHAQARRHAAARSTTPSSIRSGRRSPRLDVPVFIHTAEPQEFFQPLDYQNERWLELALFANRRNNQPGQVDVRRADDRAQQPVPQASEDALHRRALRLARERPRSAPPRCSTRIPNVVVEVGAILYDLGRQPRAAHDFFIKYQDRILFGKDSFQPEEYPYYWRVFETRRRVLRLLPRLPRLLEAVRHGPARRGAEEDLLPQRAARGEGTAARGVAAVAGAGRGRRAI